MRTMLLLIALFLAPHTAQAQTDEGLVPGDPTSISRSIPSPVTSSCMTSRSSSQRLRQGQGSLLRPSGGDMIPLPDPALRRKGHSRSRPSSAQ